MAAHATSTRRLLVRRHALTSINRPASTDQTTLGGHSVEALDILLTNPASDAFSR